MLRMRSSLGPEEVPVRDLAFDAGYEAVDGRQVQLLTSGRGQSSFTRQANTALNMALTWTRYSLNAQSAWISSGSRMPLFN